MVFPGARLFRAPLWCPSGGWRQARGREHCRGESGSALSGGYAPDLAKAEGSSIVYESGEGCTPVRENHRLRHHGLLFFIYFLRTSSAQGGEGRCQTCFLFFSVHQTTSGIGHRVKYLGSFFRVGNQIAECEKQQQQPRYSNFLISV